MVRSNASGSHARARMLVALVLALAAASAAPGPLGGAVVGGEAATSVGAMRIVNYLGPPEHVGSLMWQDYWTKDLGVEQVRTEVGLDLDKIEALGATAVRIFLPSPEWFGYPTPTAGLQSEIADVLALAGSHHLDVYLNLFATPPSYTDIAGSEQWAGDILTPLASNPTVAVVETENETNPASPSYSSDITWEKTLVPYIRGVDGGKPVAMSVTAGNDISALAQVHTDMSTVQPDVYSLHYYPCYHPYVLGMTCIQSVNDNATSVFGQAIGVVAPIPLIVGETGYSTIGTSSSNAVEEAVQADYFDAVEKSACKAGLGTAAVWQITDIGTQTAVSTSADRFFGLYRIVEVSDGTGANATLATQEPKPALSVVTSVFEAAATAPGNCEAS